MTFIIKLLLCLLFVWFSYFYEILYVYNAVDIIDIFFIHLHIINVSSGSTLYYIINKAVLFLYRSRRLQFYFFWEWIARAIVRAWEALRDQIYAEIVDIVQWGIEEMIQQLIDRLAALIERLLTLISQGLISGLGNLIEQILALIRQILGILGALLDLLPQIQNLVG